MLPEFAISLYQSFEREGIPLLLAGGWAVCHHGYARLTLDVDWVCPRSKESEAVALMDRLHFTKTSDGMASRFKSRKNEVFPYIDLIWVNDATLAIMAEPDPAETKAQQVPVISFKALLAMKLFALKDDQARQHKDLLDIRFLLSYGHTKVSDEEFRALCERYAGPAAYDKVKMNP